MAKTVLGNDPFQRGAARNEPPAVKAIEPHKTRAPVRKGWKARPKTSAKAAAQATSVVPEAARPPIPAEKADLLKGVYRALRTALGFADGPLDAHGEDSQLVRDLAPLADFLYDQYWRVTLQGAENLPAGGCLLVANHEGALPIEGPILRLALARQRPELPRARWLADESILRIPLLGVLLNRLGAVAATPENALQLLAEHRQLIVFPEGIQAVKKSFRHRYELLPFGRGGFVKIAVRAGAPIVPVAIVGAAEASPVLANLPLRSFGLRSVPITLPPLPTKWSIRLGQPLEIQQIDPEDPSEIGRWTERVRSSVQQMLQETVRQRRSIFAG